MTQPWERDWSKSDAAPAGAPWERDWSKPQAPAAKPDGQMVSGFKRSFEEVPGLAAGVAAYGADVVGADDTRDALIGYAKRKNDELAQAHQNDAQSITDTWDGKTGWLDFLANSAGYVAGQALQSIATGGLGAIGAKMVAKQGIKEAAEAVAAKAIAGGASRAEAENTVIQTLADTAAKDALKGGATAEVAQNTARDVAAKALGETAMERGAVAGAGLHNFGMELGSIYPDAVEEAEKNGKTLDGGDKFRILAAASLAAGVDTAGEAIMASRVVRGSKAGIPKVDELSKPLPGPGLLGRAAREIPAGMAREAGTEGIQTVLEQYGANKTIGDAESIKDIVDSMGTGAVGGGLGGALAARKARESAAAPVPATATAPTLQIGNTPDPYISFPDGSVGKRADVERYVNSLPEDQRAAARAKLLGLAPQKVDPVVDILSSDGVDSAINAAQRAVGYYVPRIPVGEASDVVPDETINADTALMKFRTPEQIAADGLAEIQAQRQSWPGGTIPAPEVSEHELIPTGEATVLPRSIPTGEATELEPDVAEVGAPPPPAAGMVERRNTDGIPLTSLLNAPHEVYNYLQHIQGQGTPAARAFVQDYRAGRITNDDVLSLLVPTRREPTPDQRLAAAAAQAPKPAEIKPGDLLTADGMPYGSKVAAAVRARKEGGEVVTVPGGWVIRKESTNEQPDLAGTAGRPADAGDGRPSEVVGSVLDDGQQPGTPAATVASSQQDSPVGDGSGSNGALTAKPGDVIRVVGGKNNGTIRTLIEQTPHGDFKVSDGTQGSIHVPGVALHRETAQPAATLPEKVKAKKQAAAPKKTFAEMAQEAKDSVPGYLGKNTDGEIVYEDKRGVRSILRDGVRSTEPVAMRPTRDGVKIAVEHRGEYRTAEEVAAQSQSAAAPAVPAPAQAGARDAAAPAEEPNLQAAKNLLAEQKKATGNKTAEAIVRKKLRDLAAITPQNHEKTALALDMAATRLDMGEGTKKGLEFAPEATPEPIAELTLDDELNDALGKLGDVLGDVFGSKLNITGPQYSAGDLLPALSKVIELLVRKGFKTFGQAAAKAAQLMRANEKTAAHVDAISARQWKAAYNAIADATEGTDSEEALSALTADQVKAIVAAPAAAPATLPEKVQARKDAKAAPAPLYASRPVTNAAAIMAWAKEQGFTSTLPANDLHVTVAYSRDAVDGTKVSAGAPGVSILGGARTVEPLGDEGAVVLKFTSAEMQNRWKQYREAGASWDYEGYTPHVTITYDGKGVDLSKVKPYAGPIELGAEKQEPLNVDKTDDYKGNEKPTKPATVEPATEAPQPTDTAAPAAKPIRDEAVIDLRKRLSVLEALRKCLG